MKEDKLLRTKEVTKALGINASTLWRWTKAGVFPKPIKIRQTALYKQSWIDEILSTEAGTTIQAS